MSSEGPRRVLVGERTTSLSLAVELRDAFTRTDVIEHSETRLGGTNTNSSSDSDRRYPRVTIEDPDADPPRRLQSDVVRSGYRLFLDSLASRIGRDDPDIVVNGGDVYRDSTIENEMLSDLPPQNPTVRVTLIPGPEYPFPAASTLMRGTIRGHNDAPLANIKVSIKDLGPSVTTDETGSFTLSILADKEVWKNGSRRLRIKDQIPKLAVQRDAETHFLPVDVPARATPFYEIQYDTGGEISIGDGTET